MADMDSAFRVFTSTVSDEARSLLYEIKERYDNSREDPVWAVLLAIDYHVELVGAIPAELETQTTQIVEALNEVLHALDLQYNQIEGDIDLAVGEAVREGVSAAMQPYHAHLSTLLDSLHDDTLEKVLPSFSSSVETTAKQAVQSIRTNGEDAVRSLKDYLVHTLSAAMTLRMKLYLGGAIVLMALICTIIFGLNSRCWSQRDENTAYVEAEQAQMQHENAFYQGLDHERKKLFREVDHALPPNVRLYYHP